MCTLIALWRVVDGYDLVVGMNRDESANRPSEPPSLREGDPVLVAPRDLAAGGTWIGANANGLLLALSNRRGGASTTARSRGLLVLDALQNPNVRAVDVFLQREVQAREYNSWNLLAMDRQEVRFFAFDGRLSMSRGHEGVNVLTNEGADAATDAKTTEVRSLVARSPVRGISDAIHTLQSTLRTHGSGGSPPLCVHRGGGGTVSSTILALNNADPGENVLLYADGPPCATPFRDYHEVIRTLPSPE